MEHGAFNVCDSAQGAVAANGQRSAAPARCTRGASQSLTVNRSESGFAACCTVGEARVHGYIRGMNLKPFGRIVLLAGVLASAAPGVDAARAEPGPAAAIVVAQAGTSGDGRLEPRYQPVPPEEESFYNSNYLFSLTRGVSDSTLHPAAKAPMYLFTIPLDIVLLPATLIGGLFG